MYKRQASDIEITAREIQKLKKELYTIIADHSHTSFDKVCRERKLKFSFKEQREFETIDEDLAALEQQIRGLEVEVQ